MFRKALLLSIHSVLHNFSSSVERSRVCYVWVNSQLLSLFHWLVKHFVYYLHALVRLSPSLFFNRVRVYYWMIIYLLLENLPLQVCVWHFCDGLSCETPLHLHLQHGQTQHLALCFSNCLFVFSDPMTFHWKSAAHWCVFVGNILTNSLLLEGFSWSLVQTSVFPSKWIVMTFHAASSSRLKSKNQFIFR